MHDRGESGRQRVLQRRAAGDAEHSPSARRARRRRRSLVTNTNDSGAGSLRDAIARPTRTPGPNIVNLVSGRDGHHSPDVGADPDFRPAARSPVRAPTSLTINGNVNSRIFSIFQTDPACPALDGPDYLVSISGLRLTNARRNVANSAGGAIFTEHSLALDSMVIDNNAALAGGGVQFVVQYPGQSLSITNSQFLGNFATELSVPRDRRTLRMAATAAPCTSSKGARTQRTRRTRAPVTVTIADSEFRGNAVAADAASMVVAARFARTSRADITITDTVIVDNHVEAPNPPVAGKNYHGGGFEGTAKSLRIERSEISENDAFDVTGADVTRSGGLHLYNNAVDRAGARRHDGGQDRQFHDLGQLRRARRPARWWRSAMSPSSSTTRRSATTSRPPTRTGGIIMSHGRHLSGLRQQYGPADAHARFVHPGQQQQQRRRRGDRSPLLVPFTINATNSLIEKICFGGPAARFPCRAPATSLGRRDPGPDPLLGPLAYNGGTTRTHALLAGSPAINAGSNPLALTTDQRGAGFPRVVGGATDMGAYESGHGGAVRQFRVPEPVRLAGRQRAVHSSGWRCDRPDQPQHRRGRRSQPSRADIQFRGCVSEPVRHASAPATGSSTSRSASRSTRPATTSWWPTAATIACRYSIPRACT